MLNSTSDASMIYNLVISGIIMSFITFITTNMPLILQKMQEYSIKVYSRLFPKTHNIVNIVSTILLNFDGLTIKFSKEHLAIMSYAMKRNINLHNITYLDSNINRHYNDASTDVFSLKLFNFYVTTHKKIYIDPYIYLTFFEQVDDRNYKSNNRIKFLIMQVISSKYSTTELNKMITCWTQEYIEYTQTYVDDGNIYYYSLRTTIEPITTSSEDNELKPAIIKTPVTKFEWTKHKFVSFKRFDNVFFTDKDILLKKVTYFLNNEEHYRRKGTPYNIGILLHGLPGSGKTSTIKALINHTKRHAVEINLKQIKTCSEFVNIFNNHTMLENYIPHNKKIIILEDLDCMIDLIKSREMKNEKMHDDYMSIDSVFIKSLLNNKKYKDDDALTLSCILNTIDGVLENYGRILVITTNYVDVLDDALIRPGRIDIKIKYTNCSQTMYYDIIQHYYDIQLPHDIQFSEYAHSPAEVLELCTLYHDDYKKAINQLRIKHVKITN